MTSSSTSNSNAASGAVVSRKRSLDKLKCVISLTLLAIFSPAMGWSGYSIKSLETTTDSERSVKESGSDFSTATPRELLYISEIVVLQSIRVGRGDYSAVPPLNLALLDFRKIVNGVLKNRHSTNACGTQRLSDAAEEILADANILINSEQRILSMSASASEIGNAVYLLQIKYMAIVDAMISSGSTPEQVAIAQRQSWLSERIVRSISEVRDGGPDALVAREAIGRDASLFMHVLNGMISGDKRLRVEKIEYSSAINGLEEVNRIFEDKFANAVDSFLAAAPTLQLAYEASGRIAESSVHIQDYAQCFAAEELTR